MALTGCAEAPLRLYDATGVYLEADASWQVAGDFAYYHRQSDGTPRTYSGSRGSLTLGVEVEEAGNLTLTYGITHFSDVGIHDRGEERAFIGVRWRPLAR